MTVNLDVSVVIPTLGHKKIIKVVHYLNKNRNFKISEIILSIPANKYNYVKGITKNIDNIKLVCNRKKSQVLQRINGFKVAKEKNVLINLKMIKLYIIFSLKKLNKYYYLFKSLS